MLSCWHACNLSTLSYGKEDCEFQADMIYRVMNMAVTYI